MTSKTPEDERLEAERLIRKEKLEADRWKAAFEQSERASKRQLWGTIVVALISLLGTLTGVLFGVGKKADPNITNFWGSVYQGAISSYKLIDSHYSVIDAFPKSAPATFTLPVQPATVQAPLPPRVTPTPSRAVPVDPIADGTCSGLNEQRWAIIPGPVSTFTEANGFNGYSIRLNLKNLTQDVMTIQRTGGELSDDQGHSLRLSGSSINLFGGTTPPTVVDPSVALPATFQFDGHGNTGTTVSFTVNVFTSNDDGKTRAANVIGCTSLPVHQVAK